MAERVFREDLYYRLSVFPITLPPLRERPADILPLAGHVLRQAGRRFGKRIVGFAGEVPALLQGYAWPGNIRELQNVIERACALADGETVTRRDLPDHVLGTGAAAPAAPGAPTAPPGTATDLPLKDAKERWMAVLEASYLRELLERHDGNISAAAKAAGIDRKTFHRLVNKHHLK